MRRAQLMASYWRAPVPEAGRQWELHPDEAVQPVLYTRPGSLEGGAPIRQVAISTAEAEAADQLATWSVATLCRSLSLPNILLVLTGAPPPRPVSASPTFTQDLARFRHNGLRLVASEALYFGMRSLANNLLVLTGALPPRGGHCQPLQPSHRDLARFRHTGLRLVASEALNFGVIQDMSPGADWRSHAPPMLVLNGAHERSVDQKRVVSGSAA